MIKAMSLDFVVCPSVCQLPIISLEFVSPIHVFAVQQMLQPLDLILQFFIDLVHFLDLGLVSLQVCNEFLTLFGHLITIFTQKVEFLLVELVLLDLLLDLFL